MNVRVACAIVALVMVAACMPHLPPQADAVAKPASPAAQSRSFFFEGVTDRHLWDVSIKVANGLACVVQSAPHLPRMQRFVADDPALGHIFREELTRAGYRNIAVAGDAGASPSAADYRVVAVLTRAAMNVCYPYTDNFGDGNGQASLGVEWRVYPRAQSTPAFTTNQSGYARVDSTTLAPNRILWRNAFAGAIRGLLADDGFVTFVTKPPAGSGS
jgi:hypothetical protein